MKIFIFLILIVSLGCTSIPTPQVRRNYADSLTAQNGWKSEILSVGIFRLLAYLPRNHSASEHLTIYIEGDGFSWITKNQPSTDPTPLNPIGLKLALADHHGAVAYLGRPCQFINDGITNCSNIYWTNARFSEDVIHAENLAIEQLKHQFGAQSVTLVGYSGGAAVAALVASRREDIDMLVTVAGNLDHKAWTSENFITPLNSSLNPVDYIDRLSKIKQIHFIGEKDNNIKPSLMYDFVKKFPEKNKPQVYLENDFTHQCCWVDAWPKLSKIFH